MSALGTAIRLPRADGSLDAWTLQGGPGWSRPQEPIDVRRAYAAVHVVADPLGDTAPGAPAAVDWEATLAFRRHVWSYGLGVADAMDTAQRGMGLDWPATQELIRRSAAEARACDGQLVVGVSTDHAPATLPDLDAVVAAYEEQLALALDAGAGVVLMASRQLAALATGPDDYAEVYGRVLAQVPEPVMLHWLGTMFDPALTGYWGSTEIEPAADALAALIADNAAKVDGVKVSLLDPPNELRLRAMLPPGVRVYTGDDFNYPELIKGDADGHCDALLGIFDAIAPAASAALQALQRGDEDEYERILEPTVALSRHIFREPTYHYKTGIVFLAWLAGHQEAFSMLGGMASARSLVHLADVLRHADAAGLLPDSELAASRMGALLAVAGITA
jgi:hypothetical protein